MAKTIKEINEKIKKGEAVVVTAEEMIEIVKEKGTKKAAQEVDVVTTATFGPMCSSGAYLNLGHAKPKIKLGGGRAYLNSVPVYAGFAAVDIYIGATALPDDDPRNKVYPGEFGYGGGHVIEDLVSGKDLVLEGTGYGTDCYPRKKIETLINVKDVNEAVLFNPRNLYQNYNVAVNASDQIIYTYMGTLRPNLGNANYCSAAQLSPFLNDPLYRTIGVGTRIFLGGGVGYITWWGTQHNPGVKRADNNTPLSPAGTAAVIGDLKQMSPDWLKGVSFLGYGVSLSVGIGIPIPILDEEIARSTAVSDEELFTNVVDYSNAYPQGIAESLGKVSYSELKTGKIKVSGKEVLTAAISSYPKANQIAQILKGWIERGQFFLSEPVASFPGPDSDYKFKPLKLREVKGGE
ncbi:MAG: homocysteine biosynthesis protein [Candidatus Omnitrophota bacterium]|nr:MAG: homocysteine biosynthesis protein [Candidatus Omnitrophota bacterium]